MMFVTGQKEASLTRFEGTTGLVLKAPETEGYSRLNRSNEGISGGVEKTLDEAQVNQGFDWEQMLM